MVLTVKATSARYVVITMSSIARGRYREDTGIFFLETIARGDSLKFMNDCEEKRVTFLLGNMHLICENG